MENLEDEVPAQAVRHAVKRIVKSSDFDQTERICNFLNYIVEETLEGRSKYIKAYTIAMAVFERGANFDSQVDSIVRVTASRLRHSLSHYYLTSGRDDPVRISVKPGSYVPTFSRVENLTPVDPTPSLDMTPARREPPSIRVLQLEEEGDHSRFPHFAKGLSLGLVVGLTRFSAITVFGPAAIREEEARSSDYVLRGGLAIGGDRFWLDIRLSEQGTGRILWGEALERPLMPSEMISVRSEIASSVAQVIAQPYGLLHGERGREDAGAPPDQLSSYGAVLRFYEYWRTFDRALLPEVRDALERAVGQEPDYAEALACLSLLYIDLYRFFGETTSSDQDIRERAATLADRALELAPSSSWAHYARALTYWMMGDVVAGLSSLERAHVINPNDTVIAADLGQRHAMLGDWERGVPLIENSYARNPALPGGFRVGLFLYHYWHGRFERALQEARKMGARVIYTHIATAMAAAQLGNKNEADRAVKQLMEFDPQYGKNVVTDLRKRNLSPPLIDMVVDGLRRAGMACRSSKPGGLEDKAVS